MTSVHTSYLLTNSIEIAGFIIFLFGENVNINYLGSVRIVDFFTIQQLPHETTQLEVPKHVLFSYPNA